VGIDSLFQFPIKMTSANFVSSLQQRILEILVNISINFTERMRTVIKVKDKLH
jgi:hypothetical protein